MLHFAGDDFTYPMGVFPLSNDDNRGDHAIAYQHLTLSLVEMGNVLTVKTLP